MRRLAVELRPAALDDFGLVPAVERLVETFSEQTGIPVELEAVIGDARLPATIETALYRTVQEALTNVIKHSRASRVSVLLTQKRDTVAAVIEDDGVGFDPDNTRDGGRRARRHAGANGAARRTAHDRVVSGARHVARRRGPGP